MLPFNVFCLSSQNILSFVILGLWLPTRAKDSNLVAAKRARDKLGTVGIEPTMGDQPYEANAVATLSILCVSTHACPSFRAAIHSQLPSKFMTCKTIGFEPIEDLMAVYSSNGCSQVNFMVLTRLSSLTRWSWYVWFCLVSVPRGLTNNNFDPYPLS